ncbi:hypothetical protein [Burkholderia phage BCSR5]|nr:hypothetical protein [Burkholderia phage BCSR5]
MPHFHNTASGKMVNARIHEKHWRKLPFQIQPAPEHFPVGTLFTVDCLDRDKGKVFEVRKIVQNSSRGYVLETTTPQEGAGSGPDAIFPEGMMESFHICHVNKILARGNGPLVIKYQYHVHHDAKHAAQTAEVLAVMKHEAEQGVPPKWRKGVWTPGHGPRSLKGYHVIQSYDVHAFAYLVFLASGRDSLRNVDYKEMMAHLVERHPEHVRDRGDWLEAFWFPKKWFKRWVRQNVNRFLCNLHEEQKREEEESNRMWDDVSDTMDDTPEWQPSEDEPKQPFPLTLAVEVPEQQEGDDDEANDDTFALHP